LKVKDMLVLKKGIYVHVLFMSTILVIILPFVGICLEFQRIVHRVSV